MECSSNQAIVQKCNKEGKSARQVFPFLLSFESFPFCRRYGMLFQQGGQAKCLGRQVDHHFSLQQRLRHLVKEGPSRTVSVDHLVHIELVTLEE